MQPLTIVKRLLVMALPLLLAATPVPPRTERLVYDTAGVIDDATEATLEARGRELFAKAGVAIVVLTVPRLVDETIDQLAVRVGQAWGVGRTGEDRGLVVAMARDDRRIFVATGYGTEGYLPDGRVGALLDEHALPWLRRDQFSEGIARLTTALAGVAAAEHGITLGGVSEPPVQPPPGCGGLGALIAAALVFTLLARGHLPLGLLLMVMGGPRSRGGGFGGGFGRGGFGGGGFGGGGAGRGF